MSDMGQIPPQEVKQIRVKLGTGKEWPYPVEVIRSMLETMSAECPELVGQHLAMAYTGYRLTLSGRASRKSSSRAST
jgi:hypothetical protein